MHSDTVHMYEGRKVSDNFWRIHKFLNDKEYSSNSKAYYRKVYRHQWRKIFTNTSLILEENFWITVCERRKITEVYPDKEKDYFFFQDKWSCGNDEFPYTD